MVAIVALASVWATQRGHVHSDLLYLPALARDLVHAPASLPGWHLTPAPYLVPDLLLYALLHAVTGSVEGAFRLYALVSGVGLLGGMAYAARRLGVASFEDALITGSAVLLVLACYPDLGTVVLLPSCHGTVAIAALYAVGWLGPPIHLSARTLLTASVLGGLLVASDGLALVQIVIPVLVTRRRDVLALAAGTTLVGAALRAMLWLAGLTVPSTLPSPERWWTMVKTSDHWIAVIRAFFDMAVTWPLCFVLGMLGLVCRRRPLSTYLLSTATCTLIAPVVTTLLFDASSVRYLLPWIVVLPLGLMPLVHRVRRGATAAIVAAAVVLTVREARATEKPYPDPIACLDDIEGIHRGIGDYWDAKLVEHYSRRGLRVNQFRPTLEPYGWISNDRWLLDERGYPAAFDFVLVSREPGYRLGSGAWAGLVEERFGAPARRVSCGRFDVLVYDRASDVAPRTFARVQTRLLLGLPTSGVGSYVPDLGPASGQSFRGSKLVRFESPVRGDYLDVSAPAEARWRIVPLGAQGEDLDIVDMPPMPARGPMRVRLLPFREAVLTGVRIEPQSQDEQILGHVFVDVIATEWQEHRRRAQRSQGR